MAVRTVEGSVRPEWQADPVAAAMDGACASRRFADNADHLVVALIERTIKASDDGGRTWIDLVAPPT